MYKREQTKNMNKYNEPSLYKVQTQDQNLMLGLVLRGCVLALPSREQHLAHTSCTFPVGAISGCVKPGLAAGLPLHVVPKVRERM